MKPGVSHESHTLICLDVGKAKLYWCVESLLCSLGSVEFKQPSFFVGRDPVCVESLLWSLGYVEFKRPSFFVGSVPVCEASCKGAQAVFIACCMSMKTECDYCYGWVKKKQTISCAKILPKMVNP